MIDKIVTMRREKVSTPIGRLDDDTLVRLNRSFFVFYGLTT